MSTFLSFMSKVTTTAWWVLVATAFVMGLQGDPVAFGALVSLCLLYGIVFAVGGVIELVCWVLGRV